MLLHHPAVEYLAPNTLHVGQAFSSRNRPAALSIVDDAELDYKHQFHRVPQAWAYSRGAGVKVGVLDSGLAGWAGSGTYHEDARDLTTIPYSSSGIRALGFVDDIEGSPGTFGSGYAYDDHGHGTEMVGLVGANQNGFGAVGIMPEGYTLSMKVAFNTHLRAEWHCGFFYGSEEPFCLEDDDMIRALDYAAADGVKVLSLSFGTDASPMLLDALYRAYTDHDILILAAVANNSTQADITLAKYSFALGVGGIDGYGNRDGVDQYSSVVATTYGRTLKASCPGSTYCVPAGYGLSAGTSAATATAAGIAGLLRASNPGMTAAQARLRLISTATGALRTLDAEAAIRNILPLTVSINGPVTPAFGGTYTWSAVPAGGLAPFRYEWIRNENVFTGPSYTGPVGTTSFQLKLRVIDARGLEAEKTITVQPSGTASTCSPIVSGTKNIPCST
ncbi:S8 family serine peptidase [Longimicrobium sp.]|uniref:S8 family serine peptidase n=1 Tax=Longimicrobium sp. TaxID=2029185 RepID=UPI002EDB90FB